MPNRVLKESICTSENIDKLPAFAETFFYRLIVNCDDFGRMDARPKVLAARLFPLKELRVNQVEDALRKLTLAELVTLYEVDGKPFLQLNTWDRHQQKRAQNSKYPGIEDATLVAGVSNCNQMKSSDIKCPRETRNENRETRIDIRETKEECADAPLSSSKRFSAPSLDEVRAYCEERKNGIDAEAFVDFYTAKDWMVGKNKMKDWRAAIRTWERRDDSSGAKPKKPAKSLEEEQRNKELLEKYRFY